MPFMPIPDSSGRPPSPGAHRWLIVLLLLGIFALGAIAIVLTGSGWRVPSAAKKLQNPYPATEEAVDDGMFNYMKHCQSCHGKDGDGNGPRAANLSVKPSNFTDAQRMGERTDGELFWQITQGRSPMPPFQGKLTDQERWELVDYLRSLSKPGITP